MEKNQIIAIVIVVVIVGSVGVAYLFMQPVRPEIKTAKNEIVYETIGNPEYLDPHTDYESFGSWISYNVYETLYTYDWDSADTSPSVPLLATGYTVSGDGLNWTFTLRQNVKFHDGTPFNASCVKYNFERVMALFDTFGPAWMFAEPILGGQAIEDAAYEYGEGSPQHAGNYTAWKAANDAGTGAIIVLDTYTIRFRLAYPYAAFLAAITYEVGAQMSPTWVEAHGGITIGEHNDYVDSHTCGTGPYMVTAWVPDQYIQLDVNPNYWRAASAKTEVTPYAGNITRVTIKTNEDVSSRILNLQSHTTDIGYWPVSHATQIYNGVTGPSGDGNLKSANPFLKLWAQEPTYDVMFLGFNMNQYLNRSGNTVLSPFVIKELRESLSYAFNYKTYIDNVLNGFGQQGQGPIPIGMFGHNDSLFMYEYDIEKAVDKWNEAMTKGLPAILANMSYTLDIYYNSGNTNRERACLLMKDGITAILNHPDSTKPAQTLTINVNALEWASYLYQVRNKQLPLFFLGWAPDYADPDNYVGPFVKSTGTYPLRIGLTGSPGWNAALVDGWINSAAQTQNATLRLQYYGLIQDAIVDHCAYIWAYQAQSFHVEADYMFGYQFNPMHDAYFYHYYKAYGVGMTVW
ncbi:MAG: ABC transporter substrate-binding protein [Candidatus Thorarchaeota archaeon]|nr:ABC transporter substrate-binding protein [Candidatus Thorarchaeota archaeon]